MRTSQSSSGAGATTLRLLAAPSGSERATLTFDASGAVVIRGLRLTGEVSGMFGLQADHNSLGSNSITMEDCIVENLSGDGLRVVDWGVEGGNLTIRRCMFRKLVGAGYVNMGEGCGIVSLEPTSWGRIKASHRDGMTR